MATAPTLSLYLVSIFAEFSSLTGRANYGYVSKMFSIFNETNSNHFEIIFFYIEKYVINEKFIPIYTNCVTYFKFTIAICHKNFF